MDAPVKALNTEKAKALQAALAQIEKQFGKGTIMRLGEGGFAQGRLGPGAEQAERFGQAAVRAHVRVAEQGEVMVGEPGQEGRAFRADHGLGVGDVGGRDDAGFVAVTTL